MTKKITHSERYGFDLDYTDEIIGSLLELAKDAFLERVWVNHKVWYEIEEDRFKTKDRLLGLVKCTITDEDVLKAISKLQLKIDAQTKKENLLYRYADAVNYFYNDPRIDSKGIFVKSGILGKKYFTNAELDDMQEKFTKRGKNN